MQLKYLIDNETKNESVRLVVPEKFLSSINDFESKTCEIVSYKFDASSFSQTFLWSRADSLISKLSDDIINKIIVPDVAYSLSNYLVSHLSSKEKRVDVLFYFDGSGSMMSSPIPIRTKLIDILKLFVSFLFSNAKYIIRKTVLNGADLPLCKKQLSIIDNPLLSYREKVCLVPKLIDFPSSFEASDDLVIFVLQDAKVIMPHYIKLYKKTIQFLTESYPKYSVKILLRNSEHASVFTDKDAISRAFVGESGEAVIARLKPKVVISHFSTVLFTLAFVKYKGEILSYNLSEFNDLVGEKEQVTDEVTLVHRALGIKAV